MNFPFSDFSLDRDAVAFADGACLGNPGPGGFGVLAYLPPQTVGTTEGFVLETGGDFSQKRVTNNQMELQAVLEALRIFKKLKSRTRGVVFTDSTYVVKGINEWLPGWIRKNWINSQGEPVKNRALWEELKASFDESRQGQVHLYLTHIKGHAGIPGNERVDRIASCLARGKGWSFYEGPLSRYPEPQAFVRRSQDKTVSQASG